jgi:hypothetical protein
MRHLIFAVALVLSSSMAIGQQPSTASPTATSSGTTQTSAQSTTPAASKQPAATPAPAATTSGSDAATSPNAAKSDTQTASVDSKADSKSADSSKKSKGDKANAAKVDAAPEQIPTAEVGEDLNPHIAKGSEDDVSAVGQRNIGTRGMGNWYSTNWEVGMGHEYAQEIEKSSHLITDPVIVEYVNRVGQNLVKNSDAKFPFTIKVLDTDEINAMALPGGFFYVNSGLILACDSEDELAGVMAHEIAHVAAHHAAREMTRMNYMQIGSIPLMIFTQGTWTGYGIYEASQLAVPLTFLQFSRNFEAEADYLGVQYAYRAGYDPQGMVSIFEKLDALEKHKPGAISRAFSDHPATPDRIAAVEDEIATILPARPDYLVTTSEFDTVKARLARIQNKRGIQNNKGGNKPTLRRTADTNNDSTTGDQPTLGRRN